MDQNKYSANDTLSIPAVFHPGFRTTLAVQNGVEKKIIFKVWGGIGDQICAEPTIRYALNMFKDCEVSLACEIPELFTHLKFKKVFNLKEETPVWANYLVFETITPPDDTNMVWLFFSHMLTHCVDFTSMCSLRMQLPIKDREVKMPETPTVKDFPLNAVVVHPGRHWPSKTFPKIWWDQVLSHIKARNAIPVIIGGEADDNRGTVDVDTDGCLDMRGKLSIIDSIALLRHSKVLLTNDSSPLHMAADSDCWVGFIATCKHPDYITHFRRGEFGWRMKNHGKSGMWNIVDQNPNQEKKVTVDEVDPAILASWLPDPKDYAQWAVDKLIEN